MRSPGFSSPVSAAPCLLPSVCLRYGVAMPSDWPFRTACKQRQFSDFRPDSPLDFTTFSFCFAIAGEALRVYRSLVPGTARSESSSRSQSIASCLWRRFSFVVLLWKSLCQSADLGNRMPSGFCQSTMTVYTVAWMTTGSHANNERTAGPAR